MKFSDTHTPATKICVKHDVTAINDKIALYETGNPCGPKIFGANIHG